MIRLSELERDDEILTPAGVWVEVTDTTAIRRYRFDLSPEERYEHTANRRRP